MAVVSAFCQKRRDALKFNPAPPSRTLAVANAQKGDIWRNPTIDTGAAMRLLVALNTRLKIPP